MRTFIFIFFFCLSSFAYSQSAITYIDEFGVKESTQYYDKYDNLLYEMLYKSKSVVKFVGYHPNGNIRISGYRKDGEKIKTWIYYNEDGSVYAEISYKEGIRYSAKKYYLASN